MKYLSRNRCALRVLALGSLALLPLVGACSGSDQSRGPGSAVHRGHRRISK